MLIFTKLTGIYDHIAIYILVFTRDKKNLRVILVFTHDIGIYARYLYLRMILVFTRDTGIYA